MPQQHARTYDENGGCKSYDHSFFPDVESSLRLLMYQSCLPGLEP